MRYFRSLPESIINEIRNRYKAGQIRADIARDMQIGSATVHKYCDEVTIPTDNHALSTACIARLLMEWR